MTTSFLEILLIDAASIQGIDFVPGWKRFELFREVYYM